MLVKDIQRKIQLNRIISLATIFSAIIIVGIGFLFAFKVTKDARKSIYIIDNGIPILVSQTDELLNRPVEYKAQVELFHKLFFTLPPDDKYIKSNVEKSLYLIDDSGKKEYANLREKGFYNQVISSSSMVSLKTDSIRIDIPNQTFLYYGKQMINRKNTILIRALVTKGSFKNITRTENNPHGVLLMNWRILDNSELSNQSKYSTF